MILQINCATRSGWRQIDAMLGEQLLVLGHPIAKHIGVVGWNNGHFCKPEIDRVIYAQLNGIK